MGEAFAGTTVGKKAMLWGVLAQSIPDIDFLASSWLSTTDNLLAHRGFTHSILFALILSPVLASIAWRVHRPHNISWLKWLSFFGAAILMHIFLDAFNNYGVGWFEPFSHYRLTFNIIYVADPFFSIVSAIASVMLLTLSRRNRLRSMWWKLGLGYSLLYLGYAAVNKINIDRKTEKILLDQGIPFSRYMTTPAPLQNWLWFVVAANDTGYYTGYISVFDSNKNIPFRFSPKNDSLLSRVRNKTEAEKLIRFAQNYYTFEQHADTILFNDLRFGQIVGWENPEERFAFYYYLQPDMDNTLVVQRGRFAKWNAHALKTFIHRIKGN